MDSTPWTEEENERIRSLMIAGRTRWQIATLMQKTPAAVSAKRRRMGIMSKSVKWADNPEIENEMRELWDMKWSARRIAIHLSEKHARQITRNSIIGRVNRLGIGRPNKKAAGSGKHGKRGSYRSRRSKTTGQYIRLIWSQPQPLGPGVKFRDLEANGCRYIYGAINGLDTVYCGLPSVHRSYCLTHYLCCYDDPKARKLAKEVHRNSLAPIPRDAGLSDPAADVLTPTRTAAGSPIQSSVA